MNITYYPDKDTVKQAICIGDPLLVLVEDSGQGMIVSCIDDCIDHYTLLRRTGNASLEPDRFFRVVLNKDGADWFVYMPG